MRWVVSLDQVPAIHHGLDAGQRRVTAGGREVDVGDDKGAEEPGHQAVERGQHRQAPDQAGELRPVLSAPNQGAGEDLGRE